MLLYETSPVHLLSKYNELIGKWITPGKEGTASEANDLVENQLKEQKTLIANSSAMLKNIEIRRDQLEILRTQGRLTKEGYSDLNELNRLINTITSDMKNKQVF